MTDFRRAALFLTIGSFSIAALLGVLALLSGGDFGEGEIEVLVTTLCVGVTSVLALCYLATADTAYRWVGGVGALVAVPTLALALALTWTDAAQDSESAWQVFGIGSILSLTLAQVSLLLVLATRAASYVRTLLVGTLVAVAWVAGHLSALVLDADMGDGSWRVLGVVGILDVLGTVAVTALARFGAARPAPVGTVELPADLVRLVVARAERTGRRPEDVLRSALLTGLG
jgi:hypothetical protein